jgi:Positive regulator of sigma(E), RseC/MucC.
MLLVVALLGYLLVGHSAGAIVGGIAGLLVSVLAVRKYDRSLSRIIDTKANILSVIVGEEEEKEENRT